MRQAVIVSAVRTAVGKHRGALSELPVEHYGSLVVREAVKRANINPCDVDELIFSNMSNTDITMHARLIALGAGLPIEVPAFAVERGCASSLTGLALAAMMIETGQADTLAVGGMESCSRTPYVMERPTMPYQPTPPKFVQKRSTPPEYENLTMGQTAERIAERFSITRTECDEFAMSSHQKANKAWAGGYFNSQIVPVEVTHGKDKASFGRDEIFRADITLESLGRLRPVFSKDGVVTAGNSSPLSDGAAAMIVMEKEKATALGLEILATFKGFVSVGVEPQIMGIGPVFATQKLLAKMGMTLADIDLIELNEAFASQSLACIRQLNPDMEKYNVNGGAIALGHPFAATGAILVTKMVHELKRRNGGIGLISFCIGGGQGVAALLERA